MFTRQEIILIIDSLFTELLVGIHNSFTLTLIHIPVLYSIRTVNRTNCVTYVYLASYKTILLELYYEFVLG
jgi:hypothetical protein